MKKVFLKFNREENFSFDCLSRWIDIFKRDEVYIITDLFDCNNPTKEFSQCIQGHKNLKLINSNYSLPDRYIPLVKKEAVRKLASPNLTCFENVTAKDRSYWVIDADDTRFLSGNSTIIRDKLRQCETILTKENLDAFSLDFYRCLDNNSWSYGVCLVSSLMDLSLLSTVSQSKIKSYDLPINFDSVIDVLGREGHLNIKSFVFDGFQFQHVINRFPKLKHNIYYWRGRKLWKTSLRKDVVVI